MTVYPAIYCEKKFDVINYVTLRWMTCSFMRLAKLQFETRLQMCIRMGITILKIFILGGISSDIRSKITFLAPLESRRKTKFWTLYPSIYLPKGKIKCSYLLIIPPANFVCRGYTVFTLSVRASVRPSVCPSVRPSFRPSVRNALFPFIPPANFVCRGYTVFTLSVRASVRPSVCPSVRPSFRPSVRNALFP